MEPYLIILWITVVFPVTVNKTKCCKTMLQTSVTGSRITIFKTVLIHIAIQTIMKTCTYPIYG